MFRFVRVPSFLAATPLVLMMSASPAQAVISKFDLPPQSLAASLRALGSQTSTNVLFDPPLVEGRSAAALKAELTLDQALLRLLNESGLMFRYLDERTVMVVPATNAPQAFVPVLHSAAASSMGGLPQAETGALTASSGDAPDESDTSLGEVVVTGSRIARSPGVAPASPVEVLDAQRLESTSSNSLASFLKDLPSNYGATFGSGRGVGNDRGGGTVNLRGLGPAATLVLLDGQRTSQTADSPDNVVDVNALVPQIMISRIEVVKDGASAIYGSDAVAGVVNFITKDRFTGVQVEATANRFTFSDRGERRYEVLLGSSLGDRGHFTAAASFLDQDRLMLRSDIPAIAGEAYDARWSSPTSWPGIFSIPNRNAGGALSGTRRSAADPTCGQIEGAFPSNGVLVNGVATRLPNATGATQCRFHFYPEGSSRADIQQLQTYAKFNYDVLDNLRFDSAIAFSTARVNSIYTSGAATTFPNLVVPGHNPGNIYRAANAAGQPLFAVSSGVGAGYSRDGAPVFLPARNASGQVVLTSDPTNPASGIPFYEDVTFTGRGIGSQGGLPTGNSWAQPGYSLSRPSRSDIDVLRNSAGLSGRIGENWTWQSMVGYTRYGLDSNGEPGSSLQTQLRNALQGLGGPRCTGTSPGQNGCEYYNIFGNNTFATTAGDPRANTQDVIDYIFPLQLDRFTSELTTLEASFTGSLFDLPAGSLGIAAGYQMREAGLRIDYDTNKNIRNTGTNTISYDFDESRTTHAFFAEAIAPLLDSDLGYLELSGALRHESTSGLSTTNPKLGFLYNTPGRAVTFRGTYGTSFVAPSLFRLYAVAGAGGQINDVCANPVCTGTLNQVITTQTTGNLDLKPESAKTLSLGVIVKPLPNLNLSLDWWQYDFKDRIATESPQQVFALDPTGQSTGRVIRSANGQVVQIITQYFNAPAVITAGFDAAAKYTHDIGRWGALSANLSATYVPTYKWQVSPGQPFQNFAGEENFGRAGTAPASSKWRGVLQTGWALGDHMVNASVNHIGGYVFNKGGRLSTTLNPDYEVPAWTTVDLSYAYQFGGSGFLPGFIEEASVAVGATNLFDKSIPYLPVPASQAFLPGIYEVHGRLIFARLKFRM